MVLEDISNLSYEEKVNHYLKQDCGKTGATMTMEEELLHSRQMALEEVLTESTSKEEGAATPTNNIGAGNIQTFDPIMISDEILYMLRELLNVQKTRI